MSVGVCVILVLMFVVCALIVCGANWAERKWRSLHPPDDWDGMREAKDDEQR